MPDPFGFVLSSPLEVVLIGLGVDDSSNSSFWVGFATYKIFVLYLKATRDENMNLNFNTLPPKIYL